MDKLITLLLIATIPIVQTLIGYDCGSRNMNITTVSLIDVGECTIPENNVNVTTRYIQLLQINDYSETYVIQCKLEIHRTVYYCGMHSHISVVQKGEAEYIHETSEDMCREIHRTGTLRFTDSHVMQGLRVNDTVVHSLTYAGSIGIDGKCNGASFSDPYGTWESVVVQGTLRITLNSYTARVSLDSNQIHLRSGTVCPLTDTACMDLEGGHTFWRPIPEDTCNFKQFGILYEGNSNKMIDNHGEGPQAVYSLTTNGVTFALAAKSRESVCGYTIIRTEHPKLVIFETTKGNTFALNTKVSISNLDIFTYVNSKFVYVEKHIRSQINQLYHDVLLQRCNLERQTLKNALAIATQAPDQFAYNFMQSAGYMAVMAGEVVHVIKCVPVEVKIKHAEECYAELPVIRNNITYFLTPRTHILKTTGTQVTCNSFLPSYYRVGDSWYKLHPNPSEAIAPMTIQPSTKSTWKYVNPEDLATSGIYSQQDLDRLRERIMFPVERPGLLNEIAREMHGHPEPEQQGTIFKLLTDEAVSKLAESTWNRIWNKFMTFGTVSAGIMAVLMIIQIIKAIVDIIIRGYTLHSIFGWSTHLLGALWSSVAHLLIYLSKDPPTDNTELSEVITNDNDATKTKKTKDNSDSSATNSNTVSTPSLHSQIPPNFVETSDKQKSYFSLRT